MTLLKSIFFISLTTLSVFFLSFEVQASLAADQNSIAAEKYRHQIAVFYGLKDVKNFTLLTVKGYQQTEDYTCGPATIMSLMNYYGMLDNKQMNRSTELQIAKEMGTNNKIGTTPQQMVSELIQHGFRVKLGENGTISMLREYLKNGIPVIVEWIDWGGHWEVVTGYNASGKTFANDKDTIFFANSAAHYENANNKFINGITTFNPDRFASMWFDAQYFNPGNLVKGIYIIAIPKYKNNHH